MRNYFSVGDNGKLRFNQRGSSEEIDDFKIEFQGTFDIAANLYRVNQDDLDQLYNCTENKNKNISITRTSPYQVDISRNKRVIISRFIKCGSVKSGTVNEYTNPTVEGISPPHEIEIDLQSIAQWQKHTRIYFSDQLTDQSKENLLRAKAGYRSTNVGPFEGCKMTFMIDSKIYYDSKNRILDEPLPLKIFNFCYPNFNHYRNSDISPNDTTQITNALQEMIKINLLAIIDEAQKQEKPLPFIIPAPGSFFSEVSDVNKQIFMKLIQESIKKVVKEYEPLVKKHISEFILTGQDRLWSEDFKDCAGITFHKAKSDMIEIAKKLQSQGIATPIPMMAHPKHIIGNGFLSVLAVTPVDEVLARASGNTQAICFAKSIFNERNQLKDIKTDRTFKTLEPNYFTKVTDPDQSRVYFNKNNSDQHKISVEGDLIKQCSQIDVAPMFSLAVNQAVKVLDLFAGFEDDLNKARNLKFLLEFAKDNKGVGNKLAELRNALDKEIDEANTEEGRRDRESFIKKFCSQAQTFSCLFQKNMNEMGIKTGNIRAKNIVGARLHRMANDENIEQLFQNTAGQNLFSHKITHASRAREDSAQKASGRY